MCATVRVPYGEGGGPGSELGGWSFGVGFLEKLLYVDSM